MRNRWFYSLGACAICVGFAHAQPVKPPISSTGVPRAVIPDDVKGPINKVSERAGLRGLSDGKNVRAVLPRLAAVRQLDGSHQGRIYQSPLHAERSLSAPSSDRDLSILTLQPGDKINKIDNAAANRHLTPESHGRTPLPATRVFPVFGGSTTIERRHTSDR